MRQVYGVAGCDSSILEVEGGGAVVGSKKIRDSFTPRSKLTHSNRQSTTIAVQRKPYPLQAVQLLFNKFHI